MGGSFPKFDSNRDAVNGCSPLNPPFGLASVDGGFVPEPAYCRAADNAPGDQLRPHSTFAQIRGTSPNGRLTTAKTASATKTRLRR